MADAVSATWAVLAPWAPWGVAALALAAAVFLLLRARALRARLDAAEARAERGQRESRAQESREREARERESRSRERSRAGQERDTFFEVALDLLAIADREGALQQMNPAWERLLGYPPAELLGRSVLDLVHPEDLERSRAELQRLRVGGRTVDFEIRLRGRDGTYHWLAWRANSAPGEERLYGIARDISERKKLDHIKDDFISVVSHELRTPLTSIRGSLGLLAGGVMGELPGPARELIEIAAKNSERLVRLINDILDFEKVESGAVAFRFQRVDLAAVVEQAVEANRAYAQPFDVRFEVTSTLPGAWVWADPDRLLQVLANLLSNAAKFSPRGERVALALARSAGRDGRFVVSVTDQGRGIPPDFRNRVFERFAQADASSSRQKGGTGLGLAISKTIVERHGGHIGFETGTAAGTTFFFDLPEWGVEAAVAAAPSLGPRILACEDEPDLALLLRLVLEREGYEVDVATSAAEAKRRLAETTYAAMTLDLLLPDQDGLSLLCDLRAEERTRRLPVVVVSAHSGGESAEWNGGALDILDWLVKPVDPPRLSEAVRRAVLAGAPPGARILHVEPDPDVRQVVTAIVGTEATVVQATSLVEARKRLAGERFDLVILDLALPDGPGSELLAYLSAMTPPTPALLFSTLEAGEEVARQVASVLVKSQTTNRQLLETIRAALAERPEP